MKKFLITIAPFIILLFLCMWFLWGLEGVLAFFGIVLSIVAFVFVPVKWMDFLDKHIKIKVMVAPEKIYISPNSEESTYYISNQYKRLIEYTRTDVFIEKACVWIKENITNNPNSNSVLVRNGCVTLGMLVEDFKKYMEDSL